jgi:dolichol-phosphate mannosyltransferase
MNQPRLSIVVPCFNEEGCLEALHERLAATARTAFDDRYEIILVNDGSSDSSWQIMLRLAAADPRVIAVDLSRNHGHQRALTAGLDLSRGDLILIIDADLQDPPELLGAMLETMRAEQADVVYGLRISRGGETPFKRGTAKLFYRVLAKLADTEIPIDTGDFRLMTRRALDVFLSMPEQSRFIRGMVAWIGFRQVPYHYHRDARFQGATKYPLGKMLRFALDALTGFSSAPLKLASHAGLLLSFSSLLIVLYIIGGWMSGEAVPGWTSTMLVVVVLGAIQMFVLGLMGEYIGRLYAQSKRRPLYIVQDIAGGQVGKGRLGVVALPEGPPAMEREGGERGDADHRHYRPPGWTAQPFNERPDP